MCSRLTRWCDMRFWILDFGFWILDLRYDVRIPFPRIWNPKSKIQNPKSVHITALCESASSNNLFTSPTRCNEPATHTNPSGGVTLRAHERACFTVSVKITLRGRLSAEFPNRAL